MTKTKRPELQFVINSGLFVLPSDKLFTLMRRVFRLVALARKFNRISMQLASFDQAAFDIGKIADDDKGVFIRLFDGVFDFADFQPSDGTSSEICC